MIGILIPIILILVVGIILVTHFYLRSKEKQLIIEKGLDTDTIKQLYSNKYVQRSSYNLMKIGIIAVAFGIGLGLGIGFGESGDREYLMPLCIFVFTGIGFITANIIGKKLDDKSNK